VLVTPRPGAHPEGLLQNLKCVHNQANNARGGTGVDRYNAYMRWAHESVRMLRGQVTQASLDQLVLTRTYWALQSQATSVVGPVIELVDVELTDRVSVLDDAVTAMTEQVARWSRPGIFVVADSSFYIHHRQKVEDLDLRDELGAQADPVHLLVPLLVVDELDNLKQSKDRHSRWRARNTLAVLDKVLRDPHSVGILRPSGQAAADDGGVPRGKITMEFVFDPPAHVRLPINDDEIIDRAVAIQIIANQSVTMITYDTGQSTRARAAGLTVVKLAQPTDGPEPES
jgi:hypothetical protein